MTTVPSKATDPQDPGGPMLGVCTGGRCSALWRRHDDVRADDCFDSAALSAVRRAVAATPGGVLMRLECVGACAEGALVAVAHRRPDTTTTGEVSWVAGADTAARHAALVAWIGADWTAGTATPPAELTAGLFRMVRVGGDPD